MAECAIIGNNGFGAEEESAKLLYSDPGSILAQSDTFEIANMVAPGLYTNNPSGLKRNFYKKGLYTTPDAHIYYDNQQANVPVTVYVVARHDRNSSTFCRVTTLLYSDSAGNGPGNWVNGYNINTTVYGSDVNTGVPGWRPFVAVCALDPTTKNMYCNINNTYTETKRFTNSGRFIYFAGTSYTPNTPTDSTHYGFNLEIAFLGIVSGCESNDVIHDNVAVLKDYFDIS